MFLSLINAHKAEDVYYPEVNAVQYHLCDNKQTFIFPLSIRELQYWWCRSQSIHFAQKTQAL